jgi:hypothetical protein
MAGRPTLPLGSAFVAKGPAFRAEPLSETRQEEDAVTARLVVPATEKLEEVVAAPLEETETTVGRAWAEGPGLAELAVKRVAEEAEPLARSAAVAPAVPARPAVQIEVPLAVEAAPMSPVRPAEAVRGLTPVLGLVALSIAVLGMGFGMMFQARYGLRRVEEGPAVVATAAVTATAAAPAVTATVVPAVMASAVPTASVVPVVTASAAPARPAARPQPPVKRSPEIVDPFKDKATKAAKPKLPFERPEF